MNVYFDASALVKLFLDEPFSEDTRALAAQAEVAISSVVVFAETVAAIRRAVNLRRLDAHDGVRLLGEIGLTWEEISKIPADRGVAERAGEIAWRHLLRGFDSIHLASALVWKAAAAEPLTFATFDAALSHAAQAEGFEAWP